MTATVVITAVFPAADPNKATHVLDFSATDDPRTGQINADIDVTLSQTQMAQAVKQAVADYINAQRGSTVIQSGDVRIP
jgi:hypothetical protein